MQRYHPSNSCYCLVTVAKLWLDSHYLGAGLRDIQLFEELYEDCCSCFYKHWKPTFPFNAAASDSWNKHTVRWHNATVISHEAYILNSWERHRHISSVSTAVEQTMFWPTLSPNICLLEPSQNSSPAWTSLPLFLLLSALRISVFTHEENRTLTSLTA